MHQDNSTGSLPTDRIPLKKEESDFFLVVLKVNRVVVNIFICSGTENQCQTSVQFCHLMCGINADIMRLILSFSSN
jgi:hypothetical protein